MKFSETRRGINDDSIQIRKIVLSSLRSVIKQDLGNVEVRWVSSLLYEVALNLGGTLMFNQNITCVVKSPHTAPAGIDGKFS